MHLNWINIHDFCVTWMAALIWLVQVLIYPNFKFIPESEFEGFHKRHCDRISFLVAPMFGQAFLAGLILWQGPGTLEWVFHFAAITSIFVITAVHSAPAHSRLAQGKDLATIEHLIRWNWARTLLWSAELALMLGGRFES
ncbi:MAG: hypothetical protein KGP28_03095 [Bdellovibrionales bacterium]|nr:hypothetical protein [Bdellovibrionales bacterium]